MYGWRARIGYVGLSPLEAATYELWRMAPAGVVPVATNLYSNRFSDGVSPSDLAQGVAEIDRFGVDLIVVETLAPLCALGASFVRGLSERAKASVPVVLDVDAVIEALRALHASRLVVVSPFEARLNENLVVFLSDAGFEVVEMAAAGHSSVAELRSSAPDLAWQLARKGAEAARDFDAIYIAGSDWRTAPFLQPLEDAFGAAAVSHSQVGMWKALSTLRLGPVPDHGRLLASVVAPPWEPLRDSRSPSLSELAQ